LTDQSTTSDPIKYQQYGSFVVFPLIDGSGDVRAIAHLA
jgi:hypothetical protein